jgi:biopolymer transport protein ExbB
MSALVSLYQNVQAFIELGGPVIWALLGTSLLMWFLILERTWFIRFSWPRRFSVMARSWQDRGDHHSWKARSIREELVSQASMDLHALLPMIRILVVLCPLLGLLGTVTGMIGVFDVIAMSGNDDAQAIARGVCRATIPTMSGLVVALTGIFFTVQLRLLADRATDKVADCLALQPGKAEPVTES